jgi:hypothetical protein
VPIETVFVLLLIVFIAYALFVYAEVLSREKTSTKYMFSAAIYFSIILSLLFSGTVLKSLSVETNTSAVIGGALFVVLALLYNIVILIPIRKIMRDEPLKVEIKEEAKDTPQVPG